MENLIRMRDNLENQLIQLNCAVMLAESKEDKQAIRVIMSVCFSKLEVVNEQIGDE